MGLSEPRCNGLALLLHLDDESGRDSSGNNNTAWCDVCSNWTAGGRFGGAYRFSEDHRLVVTGNASLDAPDQVTMSAWFLADGFSADYAPIVTKWLVPGDHNSGSPLEFRSALRNEIVQ